MDAVGTTPVVLVNHLGYDSAAPKAAVVAAPDGVRVRAVRLERAVDGVAGDAADRTEGGDERTDGRTGKTTARTEGRTGKTTARTDGRTGKTAGWADSVAPGGELIVTGPERVDGWNTAAYHRIDLTALTEPGTYRVIVALDGGRRSEDEIVSEPFVVGEHRIPSLVVSDVTAYFRSQRSSGEIERKDAAAKFYGDDTGHTIDARGGWLDASGDYSKFLSHLTYTRMMSPQQIPLCAWALLTAGGELRRAHPDFETSQYPRLRDEGLFGADFLVRFQAEEGYFYTGIFDALTKDLDERVINAPLQNSVRTQRWQAAYRHGGGLAIAALALASTQEVAGDHAPDVYFAAAVRGFYHLERHNTSYLFDGEESVIDDYCALLAAAELTRAAVLRAGSTAVVDGLAEYVAAASRRAESLAGRLRNDHGGAYLSGDGEGRPYFHAAESGLPVVALLRFADVLDELSAHPAGGAAADGGSPGLEETAAAAREIALTLVRGTLARVDAVDNPFGYLRQRVQPTGGEPSDAFFFPHENETGYWWQGENAGISSVAYAASRASLVPHCDEPTRERLRRLSADLSAWVGGLNPFDTCMVQGRGRNNVEYSGVCQNSPGGIVNGITGGWTDERDIAFLPAEAPEGEEWRWAEQWIPHSAWYLLAVCAA